MGVLGMDLLDFHRPRTNTKVEFGASGYWVESHPTMQPYGAVLTEILNLDAAPFQELLDQYRKTVAEKDAEQAARAFQAVTNGFASLPLYRLYWNDVQLFASMDVRELFVGEAQEAFREYAMQDDTLPRFMQEQLLIESDGFGLMLTITDLKRKPDIIDEGNKIVVAFFCRYLICLAC